MTSLDRDAAIDAQIRRGNYDGAIRLLKVELERLPGNARLAQKLADVLARAGHRERAADICCALAEAYARDGFTAKAIATLKKVQHIDRRRPEAEMRLAELILERQRELASDSTGPPAPTAQKLPVRSPLFVGIEPEELVAAIGGLELRSLPAGEIVFAEGEPGSSLYVLASGKANVFVRDEAGRSAKVRSLEDGDFFGEIALVSGGRRTATVITATEAEILRLDRSTLAALAERFPRIEEVVRDFASMRSGSPEEVEARLSSAASS